MGFSLEHIGKIHGLQKLLDNLSYRPLCLIEGCTAPTNGTALKRFLEERFVEDPRIEAIDIMDISKLLGKYGLELYETFFRVADARNLRGIYPDRSVDIVAQDFLLNCAPHSFYAPILSEMSRILHTKALAIICFTDNNCILGCEKISPEELKAIYGIPLPEDAYCLRDAVRTLGLDKNSENIMTKELTKALGGKVIANGRDECILITKAGGNFEFFEPYKNFQKRLENAGMEIYGDNISSGIDRNGITCVRYRTIIKKV